MGWRIWSNEKGYDGGKVMSGPDGASLGRMENSDCGGGGVWGLT
jgi:hypothetical protein